MSCKPHTSIVIDMLKYRSHTGMIGFNGINLLRQKLEQLQSLLEGMEECERMAANNIDRSNEFTAFPMHEAECLQIAQEQMKAHKVKVNAYKQLLREVSI